jgi:hypothetical protein
MGSLLERLEQREATARTRVAALRAELDALAERLAAEETLLSRLEITRQTVLELLAGDGGDLGEEAVAVPTTGVATAPGTAVQVPCLTPDGEVAGQGLPVAYRDVVEVLADVGRPLRAMQVCQALGLGGEPRHREGMRSKLKRLVKRGWLVEVSPGLFACAEGVAGALDGAAATRRGEDEVRGSSS